MNQDKNKLFPNQITDNDQTECVALTVTDILGNILGQTFDPDFPYAYTLRLMGSQPTTAGLDPLAGMYSAIVYGLLPVSMETFTSKVMGELYVANYQNYSPQQIQAASQNVAKGIKFLDGFNEITAWLSKNQGGVSLPMTWYQSFNTPNADGTLPAPSGLTSQHNVAVYDYDLVKGLLIKPWLGANYGQGGYVWLSPAQLAQVSSAAYAFDPNGWRWWSLVLIALRYPINIRDILPKLQASQNASNGTQTPATATQPAPTYIDLAGAIRDYEGAPGDLNYLLNNPGDCRPSPDGYLAKYEPVQIIDTDTDPRYPYRKGKFAKFPTYAIGWLYLCNMLHNQIENHPNWTLLQLMTNFSPPSDGNNPDAYAKNIAGRLKVGNYQTFQIKNLV